jgi:hypothetical protein
MVDDGENLTPVNVEPQMIPAAAWETFKAGGDQQGLDELRRQIEATPPPSGRGTQPDSVAPDDSA